MSVIQEQEFNSKLYAIQNLNPPSYVLFPEIKTIYDIDLQKRTVSAPKHLGVQKDHEAETIYFKVDRFHDHMDLANTSCIVQYTIPGQVKKTHLYIVPFYDLVSKQDEKKMLIPWSVDVNATKVKGTIEFSFRFFVAKQQLVIVDDVDSEGNPIQREENRFDLLYNLTTLPAYTTVLEGMDVSDLEADYMAAANAYEELVTAINEIKREGVYWTIYPSTMAEEAE